MRLSGVRRTAIGMAAAVAVPLFASQEGGQRPDPPVSAPAIVYRSQSDLVLLHVSVFDRHHDAVQDLPESAFQVFEDGTPQRIDFFIKGDVPVAVGLAIDDSTSMIARRKLVAAGVAAFGASSHEEDELFTIVFNEQVRYGLPDGVPFTRDRELLHESLRRRPMGGRTALHDAVVEGLDHLEESSNQKRVLLVLSDGDDNASQQSASNMLYRASQSSALIYTVWTGDLISGPGNAKLLDRLATRNGGFAYKPKSDSDVVRAFTTIATNIRQGYSIGYVPTNLSADGKYRKVKVVVRARGRSLSVRARDGYTAPDNATVSR
jgi:Ca-activated chloride channel homolog